MISNLSNPVWEIGFLTKHSWSRTFVCSKLRNYLRLQVVSWSFRRFILKPPYPQSWEEGGEGAGGEPGGSMRMRRVTSWGSWRSGWWWPWPGSGTTSPTSGTSHTWLLGRYRSTLTHTDLRPGLEKKTKELTATTAGKTHVMISVFGLDGFC